MNVSEVRSGDAPTDSDNESGVTSETVREAVSSMGTDQSDGVTVRELLNALVEKDRVLTTLLERLTPSATPQPMSAGTPGGIAAFQVMPDLSNNITSFNGCEDAPSAKDWIENIRTTATLHSWPESFMLETAKSRLTGPARDWLRSRRSNAAIPIDTQRHCKEAQQRNEAHTVTEPVCEIKSASVLLKEVTLNGKFTVVGLIDTGSSGCLLRAIVPETTDLYGFGNSTVPAAKSIGRCKTDLCIDGVLAKDIPILVVPDEAQSVDLLVGRTFTELPYIAYARIGGSLRFWHCSNGRGVHGSYSQLPAQSL
ncbi:hypothetical protein HPB49_000292 [Dermacentor silvarum]|uniref:Uncharacterized protein n=1 Tax=Dermacentor silvarum TaxID=543639 RepID=A0ACB8CIR8_DERSI|nr:hypothetical protein HPB49_000292 [Dermacentor silvarum]